MLEPRRAVMTGLSRDGAFLIERGKITRPVSTLRFTDSFSEASMRMDEATRARSAVPMWWAFEGTVVCPAVRIRALRFTGAAPRGSRPGSDKM